MQYAPVVIIGAGQAGLAMSHCLTQRRIEHVVLERGQIAERWRSERWDSLHLLTPNWMSRLPGWSYRGDQPDGFMSTAEFIGYLADYAASSRAPVEVGTTVLSVRSTPFGYRVETSRVGWETSAVVIATGHSDIPRVPAFAQRLPGWIHQFTPSEYRSPAQVPGGGVLVVGASATGVQLAAELRQSGHDVALSVGHHTRVPRRYRGRDTWWWLERIGVLDEATDEVSNLGRARGLPSFQLVGGPDARTIDLGTLRDAGVRILGRTVDAAGAMLGLRDDLSETTGEAQAALERLLSRIDVAADAAGAPRAIHAARHLRLDASPTVLDLGAEGIRSVLWATGYKRNYSWLQVPVLDAAGEIRHDGGITPSPGLYVLGLNFLRRRRSHFIDGVGFDAVELAEDIQHYLARTCRAVA
jgi:putative flavoprotein involved in K+ transport